MPMLRLGLAGAGRWGRVYLRTLETMSGRARVTHLATSKPGNAQAAPAGTQVVPTWRELVASDCDAVIIATPPGTHADIVEACLNAGKPCLVEKPLCLDVSAAERLADLAQRTGVPVLVDHIHLFDAAYEELRRRLQASGEPARLVVSESGAFGPFRRDTSVLWDRGPHDVSLCLDVMGRMPEVVMAVGGPQSDLGLDAVAMRLEFPGSASAWITTGRISPAKQRRLTVFAGSTVYVLDELADAPLSIARVDAAGQAGGQAPSPVFQPVPGLRREMTLPRVLAYFFDGLSGGDRSRFGLELGVDVVRVLARAEESLQAHGAAR